jgi:CRISPR-associated protein Csb2
MKPVRPVLPADEAVHYVWSMADEMWAAAHADRLGITAKSVVALGWGIDLAIASAGSLASDLLDQIPGDEWIPQPPNGSARLRVPVVGSFEELRHRHARFLQRVSSQGFTAPPPPTAYRVIHYRPATEPVQAPSAAFSLLTVDGATFRAFDSARSGLTVAAMTRHLTRRAAERAGWSVERVNRVVLGHASEGGAGLPEERFLYMPLPSLQPRGERVAVVGQVRRVMVTGGTALMHSDIAWVRRALSGQDLTPEGGGDATAMLAALPASDPVVARYTRSASVWASVTPVTLPGHDDPRQLRGRLRGVQTTDEQHRVLELLDRRVDRLLRKAVVQAGVSQELASHAELDWSATGYWPGVEHVSRYGVPDHLARFPRLHVRIAWRNAAGRPVDVPGPVCLGGGRFYGLGLMAPLPAGRAQD